MKRWLVIAAYTCRVSGALSEGIDFQVRFFDFENEFQVEEALRAEPRRKYLNSDDETVEWSLQRIYAVEEYFEPRHGDEIVGFIRTLKGLNEDFGTHD